MEDAADALAEDGTLVWAGDAPEAASALMLACNAWVRSLTTALRSAE